MVNAPRKAIGVNSIMRRWTEEEDNILRAEYATADLDELARRLGRSWQAISDRAHRVLGATRLRPGFEWTKERDDYLLGNLGKKSTRMISDALGCPYYVVTARIARLRRLGILDTVPSSPRGGGTRRKLDEPEPPWIELTPINTGGGKHRKPPAARVYASGELILNHAATDLINAPSGRVRIQYNPQAERVRLIPSTFDGANSFALSGGGNSQHRLSVKQMVRHCPEMIGDYRAVKLTAQTGIELRKLTDIIE